MNLWLSVIDQGTGISLPIGTSLDGVPICELVFYIPSAFAFGKGLWSGIS
jgi:hypothetical protein